MIIRAENRKQTLTEHLRGGDGTVDKRDYLPDDMPENAKMFAEIRLEPGCSIGLHKHTGEYEILFYKEGEIVLNDDGREAVMHLGDFSICPDGGTHGIANRSNQSAAVYAAIIKTK